MEYFALKPNYPSAHLFLHLAQTLIFCSMIWLHKSSPWLCYNLILDYYLLIWHNPIHKSIIQETLFINLIYYSYYVMTSMWNFPFQVLTCNDSYSYYFAIKHLVSLIDILKLNAWITRCFMFSTIGATPLCIYSLHTYFNKSSFVHSTLISSFLALSCLHASFGWTLNNIALSFLEFVSIIFLSPYCLPILVSCHGPFISPFCKLK